MNSWILYEGDLPGEALDFAKKHNLPLVNGTRVVMGLVIKPLNKNIAIGFFGGDWAKALEKRCDGIEHSSGKSNPKCDDLSIAITKSALSNISGEKKIDEDIQEGGIEVTRWSLDSISFGAYSVRNPEDGTSEKCWLNRWRTKRDKAPVFRWRRNRPRDL